MGQGALRQVGRPWAALIAALLVLAVLGGLAARGSLASAEPRQPIAFDHQKMVGAGTPCLFCHSDATRSPSAGIPSVALCMGCHDVIATDSAEVALVRQYWSRQQPIPWVRLNRLPRFVYFSHQAHVVAAARNCEQCHGDVGRTSVTKAIRGLDMGWCVGCHERQPDREQLLDCVVCHQ